MGTADYLAPEILRREWHDERVDFWALGVVLYQMLAGETPFFAPSTDETFRKVRGAAGGAPSLGRACAQCAPPGVLPRPSPSPSPRQVLAGNLEMLPEDSFTAEAVDVVRKLLVSDPEARLGRQNGCTDIMQHPFFAQARPPTPRPPAARTPLTTRPLTTRPLTTRPLTKPLSTPPSARPPDAHTHPVHTAPCPLQLDWSTPFWQQLSVHTPKLEEGAADGADAEDLAAMQSVQDDYSVCPSPSASASDSFLSVNTKEIARMQLQSMQKTPRSQWHSPAPRASAP